MRVAVIGSTGGWHAEQLERALRTRGHECVFAPVTRMVGRIDGGLAVRSRDVQHEYTRTLLLATDGYKRKVAEVIGVDAAL